MCYPHINTFKYALKDIYKENKLKGFFKGYGSSIVSLTPFISLNFTIFDILKENLSHEITEIPLVKLSLGGTSALFAQTICYPLDTIRRRMQNKNSNYKNGLDVANKMIKYEGYLSFYKGIVPNILRMVPNTAIRFLIYDYLKENF